MTIMADKQSRAPLLVGLVACLLIVGFSIYGIVQDRGLKLDFANFYDAGQKAALGQIEDLYDPFAQIGGAAPFGNMSFVSAPVSSYFYAPMAALPPAEAAIVFKALMTLCLFLALILLFLHLNRRFGPGDPVRFFAIYSFAALIFMPFWVMFVIGGQTTPVSSYFYAPMAALPPAQAAIVFKTLMTLCLFLALILLFLHLNRRFGPGDPVRFFAIYSFAALIFMPFWVMFVIGGQTTPVILLLLVLALIGVSNGRTFLPALALVLATLIKPVFAPGMVLILILSDAAMRKALLTTGIAVAVASVLIVGIGPHLDLARKILSEGSQLQIPHLNSNMVSWVEPLFLSISDYETLEAPPGALRALLLALKLGLSAILIGFFLRLRRETKDPAAERHFMILIAVFISLIITPAAWAHYLSFLFVLPIMVFANTTRFSPAAQATAALAILFAFFQHPLMVREFIKFTDAAGGGTFFLSVEKWWVLFSITFVKAIPMLLIFALVTIWSSSFIASYRAMAGQREEPKSQV